MPTIYETEFWLRGLLPVVSILSAGIVGALALRLAGRILWRYLGH